MQPRLRNRLAASVLLIVGAAMAGGGAFLVQRTLRSERAIAAAYGVRNGGLELTAVERDDALARLDRVSRSFTLSADEEAASTFLHYAAAEDAARRQDADRWRQELRVTKAAAQATLRLSPTRADVSLALAEVEYLLHDPAASVEAAVMLSYLSAPRELWIARRRIGIGLRLVPDATPDLEAFIEAEVRNLGRPFESLDNYMALARAAMMAGPTAVALVREILARGHPWPFRFFNEDLDRLSSGPRAGSL